MQFTLSRLLAATALVAVGISGVTLPVRVSPQQLDEYHQVVQTALQYYFLGSGVIIGAGVGVLFKRLKRGAFWGFLATIAVFLICVVVT